MIHWAWLLPAFGIGGLFGVGLMCLLFMAKHSDEAMERMRPRTQKDMEDWIASGETGLIDKTKKKPYSGAYDTGETL